MTKKTLPHFEIKNNFQKGGAFYKDLLPLSILSDVCEKVTGKTKFTYNFDDTGYNIGRLATLEHNGKTTYISFSEIIIKSRNASFQSFPSALSRYLLDTNENKEIFFYFHPETKGNFETDYFVFMYRLMKTAGVRFLNLDEYVTKTISPFSTPDDIVANKDAMRSNNPGNKSTYLTRGSKNQIQIYGKTYGANKYETTLLCVAISKIATSKVELFEIEEGGLKQLPKISKEAIESLGVVKIFTSNIAIETAAFKNNDSLRSIKYIYNLLDIWGDKKCVFCDCEIPQIIQGAHIWPVAAIKINEHLNHVEKLNFALDGKNGVWLCENHHKLFDTNLLIVSNEGIIKHNKELTDSDLNFIKSITTNTELPPENLTDEVIVYLNKRNEGIQQEEYNTIT